MLPGRGQKVLYHARNCSKSTSFPPWYTKLDFIQLKQSSDVFENLPKLSSTRSVPGILVVLINVGSWVIRWYAKTFSYNSRRFQNPPLFTLLKMAIDNYYQWYIFPDHHEAWKCKITIHHQNNQGNFNTRYNKEFPFTIALVYSSERKKVTFWQSRKVS